MKNTLFLIFFILTFQNLFSQSQFPQVYYNGQGSGGANLLIHSSNAYSSSTITTLSTSNKIGAESLSTNSSDSYWINWIKVCLPSTSSTNNNPNYGYMPCDEFYARINETNNYATVNTTSTPLGVRTCAGCSSSYVTISSQNAYYGKNSILVLTGNSSSGWYEIYLTNNCSQSTGWVNGIYLSLPSAQSYKIIGGRVCNDNCDFVGNVNQATIQFNGLGATYSSGGFYQYKVQTSWNSTITCSHPNYNTSTPASYTISSSSHSYNKHFKLTNTVSCTGVSISSDPVDQTITVGSTATFTVGVNGTSPFSYQWKKNGNNISGATSSSYTTPTLTLSDNGNNYSCYVTNCNGNNNATSNNATLTVTNSSCTGVSITTQPQDQTKTIGSTATFSVTAIGTTPMTYQWSKNSNNISGATSASYTTPTLTPSDNGNNYSCYVTNCNGNNNATSNNAILTVNNTSTGTISGSIYVQNISDVSGGVINNTVNSTVRIYATGSSIPLSSISNSNGVFSFTGLANGNYDIQVEHIYNGNTFKSKKTNIAVNSTNLKFFLSSYIHKQIKDYNYELENLKCYLEQLGVDENIRSYNLQSSYDYINTKIILSNNDNIDNEAMLRLAMAERILVEYFDLAKSMGQEYVLCMDDVSQTIFAITKVLTCTEVNPFTQALLESTADAFKNIILTPFQNMNSPYKNYFITTIDGLFDILTDGGISPYTVYNVIMRPEVEKSQIRSLLGDLYVNQSYGLDNEFVLKSQNQQFSGNIATTVSNNLDRLRNSTNSNADVKGYSEGVRNDPAIIRNFRDFSAIAASTTCYSAWPLTILGLGANYIHYRFLSRASKDDAQRLGQLIDEVRITGLGTYNRNTTINGLSKTYDFNTISNIVDSFNYEYNYTINKISLNQFSELDNKLGLLIRINNNLNFNVGEAVKQIRAAYPYTSLADTSYFELLKSTNYISPATRLANLICLNYLAKNLSDNTIRDSIIFYAGNVVTANSQMLSELDNFITIIENTNSPGYISVVKNNVPKQLELGNSALVNLDFKNYGKNTANNVQIVCKIDEPYHFSIDSLIIGSIEPDSVVSVPLIISAPSIYDSAVFYSVHIISDNANTQHFGGSISLNTKVTKVYNNTLLVNSLKIIPNPNNGLFSIEIGALSENSNLYILNNLGQIVFDKKIKSQINTQTEVVDLKNYPKGVYYVQLKSESKTQTQKIVIN